MCDMSIYFIIPSQFTGRGDVVTGLFGGGGGGVTLSL